MGFVDGQHTLWRNRRKRFCIHEAEHGGATAIALFIDRVIQPATAMKIFAICVVGLLRRPPRLLPSFDVFVASQRPLPSNSSLLHNTTNALFLQTNKSWTIWESSRACLRALRAHEAKRGARYERVLLADPDDDATGWLRRWHREPRGGAAVVHYRASGRAAAAAAEAAGVAHGIQRSRRGRRAGSSNRNCRRSSDP